MLAVDVTYSGSPVFGGNPGLGYNIITAGMDSDGAIWAETGATPNLGSGGAGPNYAGKNSIIRTGGLPAAAIGATSSIDAAWCWWGQYPAPSCYGNVDTHDALNSNPGGGSSIAKSSSNSQNSLSESKIYNEVELLWREAWTFYEQKNYLEAVTILNNIITNFNNVKISQKSINLIDRIFHEAKVTENVDRLDHLFVNVQNDTVKSALKMKQIQFMKNNGNFDAAIALCTVMARSSDSSIQKQAYYDLYNIYKNDKNDIERANEMLSFLKTNFPDDNLTLMARVDNNEDVEYVKESRIESLPKAGEPIVLAEAAYSLGESYPNPFNPTTTISIVLPEETKFNLAIFDILGRKVWEYSKNYLDAGNYEIVWDGKNTRNQQVSAGVYIIKMTTPKFSQNQKVVYLK